MSGRATFRLGWLLVTALTVILGSAVPALAAEGAAHAGGHGEESGGGHAMLLVWQTVNFVLLLAVLAYFARKPIQNFFASRRTGIGASLDEAASLLAEAERRYAEWQRKLIDLDRDLERIRTEGHQRAQDDRELILAEAQAAAERIHKNAVATIEQELRRAQAELRNEAAVLATEIAERILREKLGDSDRDRLLDEFITRVEPSPGSASAR